jgi:hypothetical protein
MPRQPMIASTPGTLGMAAVHGLGFPAAGTAAG